MRKYLFVLFIIVAYNLQSYSQSTPDSMIIRNLKTKLKDLNNTSKVDCLNDMAMECQYIPSHRDSMGLYASEANKLAKQLNYKKGIARSMTYLGLYELHIKDQARAENYFQQSELIGKDIKDDATLGWNYLVWSEIYADGGDKSLPKRQNDSVYIDFLKKANSHFQKAGDEEGESEASTWLCLTYLEEKPDLAFEYCKRTLELARIKRKYHLPVIQIFGTYSFVNMSQIFETAGDYEAGMDYLLQGREYDRQFNTYWDLGNMIGALYCKMNKADSAIFYCKKNYDDDKRKRPKNKILLGNAYLINNEYDLALPLFKSAVDSLRTAKNEVSLPKGLISLAKAYEGKKGYKTALKYAQEGFQIAMKRYRTEVTMEGANVLSRLFHQLKRNDSAYHYLKFYTALKDSANNKQNLWKLNIKLSDYKKAAEDAKKEARMGFLDRDNKIKEEQLKQEASLKKFLLIGLALLLVSVVFIFRYFTAKRKNEKLQREQAVQEWKLKHLESEKKQIELQRQAAELEMQALRAQMNPHFIFNCLSSINRIIMKNDSQSASDYLTRFSRLMRMVLINSQRSMIPLEDELQMLRLYLDMERLRFKDSFNYSIIFTNTIDEGAVFVPPLLLQPFCENAIWHGLMQKDDHGHLNIELSMENKVLQCTISDDGIGREAAEKLKSKSAGKQKSMGLQITEQRLALLNQNKNIETFYSIEDIRDGDDNIAGTRVNLKIDYKEFVEEAV